ncbi:MAG: hypothetical protein ACRD2T_15580 [Thermoanaerobaculia bacterium]
MISPVVLTLPALLLLAAPPAPIAPEEFRRLHRELSAAAPEKWETIPWRTGLLDARAEAARERKPLFLWSMNGHPLGCT